MPRILETIEAPFTEAQVAALDRWQRCGWVHGFTCPKRDRKTHTISPAYGDLGSLIPQADGWLCPDCGYRQYWAHAGMLTTPRHPLEGLRMTTNVKIQSFNHPAKVEVVDRYQGNVVPVETRILKPADGEVTFYATTSRTISVVDLEYNDPLLTGDDTAADPAPATDTNDPHPGEKPISE